MNKIKNLIVNVDLKKSILLFLYLIFAIKILMIWYYGGRNINMGVHPYITMYFDPFHRFTDFLLIWDVSHHPNMYDLENTAPYGFLTFFLMGFPFINEPIPSTPYSYAYLYFFILLSLVFMLAVTFYSKLEKISIIDSILFIAPIFILTYPFGFLVDRGNVDIFALIFLFLLFHIITFNKNNVYIRTLLIFVISSLKPIFLVFLGPYFLSEKFRYFFLAFSLTAFTYFIPIIFFNAEYGYLITAIEGAQNSIKGTIQYCHSLPCSLRIFDLLITNHISPYSFFYSKIFLLFMGILYLLIIFGIDKKILHLRNVFQRKFYYFSAALLFILYFNDPSPDYRLTFLLPFFLIVFHNQKYLNPIDKTLTFFSFLLIFSFTSISFVGVGIPYDSFLRFLGLILFNILIIRVSNYIRI